MTKNEQRLADERNYYIYDQYGDNPMPPLGPVGLISLTGSVEFTASVNNYLTERRAAYSNFLPEQSRHYPGFIRNDYRIPVQTLRFSSGEGKGSLSRTVRGHDLFIITDVLNYSCTYKMRGLINHMSPDDHYQDLKRVILAISGKARRINVIMPFLYESRQHRKNSRESLDCAHMLEELFSLGISNLITFDAHDPGVSNAIPTAGFENIASTYQTIKALFREVPDLDLKNGKFTIISPDEGAIKRAMYYASILGTPLGTFYKRRDYTNVVNGRNPIIAHEFLGDNVKDMDVLIVDDMISSGESILDIAYDLKKRKAKRIFCATTFGLFTDGLEKFNKAYEDGIISKVFSTNLIYRSPEILSTPWFVDVSMSKFVALLIDAINHDSSLSKLMDPTEKIKKLLAKQCLGLNP